MAASLRPRKLPRLRGITRGRNERRSWYQANQRVLRSEPRDAGFIGARSDGGTGLGDSSQFQESRDFSGARRHGGGTMVFGRSGSLSFISLALGFWRWLSISWEFQFSGFIIFEVMSLRILEV